MTADKKSKVAGGRCVLVGIQMDGNGRELLSWALTNVAGEGDRVIAAHVSRTSDLSRTSRSLARELDGFLAELEELRSSKRLALEGRVSRGTSIRRTLAKEAALCSADVVVVGVMSNFSLGGSASVAKYCEKKLPPATALIAFHDGKVVFEKGSIKSSSGMNSDDQMSSLKPNLRSILHPSVSLDAMKAKPETESRDGEDEGVNDRRLVVYNPATSVISRPGWPLLRRAVRASAGAREMSVVQWVMSLPDRSSTGDLVKELEAILQSNSSDCRWFQYEELQTSTKCFSKDCLIGKGGSGRVYKGSLADGQKVAIKTSRLTKETSRDFMLEADIVTRLQHERIVPLLGVCVEGNTFLSIYGYFPNGSLEENIHGVKPPLDWGKRFKIAVGVAEALSYLHGGCPLPVIHRDVKSSNILLDDDFEPQISDFGLAIWAPRNSLFQTHSDVVGTFGYLAPEYFMYGKVSDKIDVYAYGVVLLELLTGRKPINDESPKGQESLVMWATPILEKGGLKEFLDPSLEGEYDENQLRRMILVASLCITRAARLRPEMSQVIRLLQGEEGIESWASSKGNDAPEESDFQDEESYPSPSVGSHLGLALLDVEDDDASVISFEQNHMSSLDDYLRDRWSRSSSFD